MARLFLAVALVALSMAGPARGASPDYFPLTSGTEWVYRTSVGQDLIVRASGTTQVGGIACQILESMINGVVTQRECYRREGGTLYVHVRIYPGGDIMLSPPQPMLVLPPTLGRGWSWNGKAGATPARVAMQWAKMEQVTTAAGTFAAAQLYLEGVVGEERVQSWRWFAPGVGMVREDSIATSDGGSVRIVAELREFRPPRR
ncbi:MAG TPA: hypothetical protein VGR25_05005 [bacterium]|jgi:hypothetical protein|nr:hypothetical protein [bacterium]